MTGEAPGRASRADVVATLALVAITAIWGSTFIVVKDAIATMPVMAFLAWRFAIATMVMVALRPRSAVRLGPAGRHAGALLGIALGVGYVAQTFGLRTTPASVSGFITGMFVVFTPLIGGLLLHQRVPGSAWLGVALATAGLAVISLRGLSVGAGELLTLLCAVAFAFHIVGLGRWSPAHEPFGLAVMQLGTVALMCAVVALPAGGLPLPHGADAWRALALTAVLATAVAFVVQTWAQAILSPTRAAVIMTMEPVFAGLFAVAIGGETLGPRTVIGGAMVLAAMFLVELGPRHAADASVERLEV